MGMMIKKRCLTCGVDCWHNPTPKSKTDGGGLRCTNCAHPVGTGPKREMHELAQKKALARAGRIG